MPHASTDELLRSAVACHQAGRLAEAESLYRQVLQRNPNEPDALHLLGVVAHQAGQNALAMPLIQRALVLRPGQPIYHNSLGEAYRAAGQLTRAIEQYRLAMARDAGYIPARLNLGTALQAAGLPGEAAAAYRAALQLAPDRADVLTNLGAVLAEAGQLDEAEAVLRRAVAVEPDRAMAWSNLGLVLQEMALHAPAEQAARRAAQLGGVEAHSNLLLSLHYARGDEAQLLLDEHRAWASRHADPLRPGWPAHQNEKNPGRRLRVGYVSADLRAHPVGFFIEPLLAGHDRERFEVYCYANVPRPDGHTQRLASLPVNWRDIARIDEGRFAAQVVNDRIDILVDLAGHTAGHRLMGFALKPAPVQVSGIGYPDTSGLAAMDWRLSDEYCDPPGSEAFCRERIFRLDGPFLCYAAPADGPPLTPLPALQRGRITFGCFNNFAKVTEPMLRLWAALLRRVDGARLLLKSKALASESVRRRVMGLFADEAVAGERVELLAQTASHQEHLRLYSQLDIALDTFAYCGTTTSCEAMWMGVPVVTRAGRTHVARVGASLATWMGCERWVARSEEEYLAIAAELASDLPRLAELRAGLRARMQASALCDRVGYVRRMETAYRSMWADYCRR